MITPHAQPNLPVSLPASSRDGRAVGDDRAVRGAVGLVVVIAVAVRLWFLSSLPLIITNDAVGYLHWGEQLSNELSFAMIPAVRTPGYPLFLGGVFALCGVSAVAVLVAQHLLGCLTAALVTWTAARRVGGRWAVLPGLVFALDPWLLAAANFALTETLSIALVMSATAMILGARRPGVWQAIALGLLLGAACMVRPAFQIIVPFFVLAWAVKILLTSRRWARALIALALSGAAAAAVMTPWVRFNKQRQVDGVAEGYSVFVFKGLLRFGLLDLDYPIEPEIREAFAAYREKRPTWDEMRALVNEHLGGFNGRTDLIRPWIRASILARPGDYLRHCGYTLCWQLNHFSKSFPQPGKESFLDWTLRRLARDGDGLQFTGDPEHLGMQRFIVHGQDGLLRRLLGWLETHSGNGAPQFAIFAAALLATGLSLLRRDWPLLLVLAGTLAFTLAHVMMLFPVDRYLMPMWPIWQIMLVIAPYQILTSCQDRRRARSEREAGLEAA